MNLYRHSVVAALAMNLAAAPAVVAASDPSSASLSHAQAQRGLEQLLVQRADARWAHLGLQVLSSVGGALLWAAVAPMATNALSPGGDNNMGLGPVIINVTGSGLFAYLGPALLEGAWMRDGEVIGEAYQHVRTIAPDRPISSLPDPLVLRIREALAQESSRGTSFSATSSEALARTAASDVLLPASTRGPLADFFEVTAAGGLNLLVSCALGAAGGYLLGNMANPWPLAGANYIVSSLALAPLGCGTTDLLFGDPRSAMERVGHAYALSSVTAMSALAASSPFLGPLAPYSMFAGALFTGGQALSDGDLAVEKKWAREASAQVPVAGAAP